MYGEITALSSTWRMSDHDDPQASPGVHVPPPFFYAGAFGLGLAAHRRWPVSLLPPARFEAGEVGGLLLVLAAMALLAWAVATFWRAKTTIIPHRRASFLALGGPYRFTRNPMYVGMALLYLGLTLLLDSPWPLLLLPVVLLIVDRYVIRREERHLEARFGADFDAYRRRVRRWL